MHLAERQPAVYPQLCIPQGPWRRSTVMLMPRRVNRITDALQGSSLDLLISISQSVSP